MTNCEMVTKADIGSDHRLGRMTEDGQMISKVVYQPTDKHRHDKKI